MAILIEYDYKSKKKQFIEKNLKNGENLFKHFNNEQIQFLMNYYEQYTKYLFYKLRKNLRLEVSKNKIKVLSDLKGEGEWEFAGMRDTKGFGQVYCELGHPLRYEYKARNKTNGNTIIFGSTCVGDFFELDQKGVNALKKLKDTMNKELQTLIAVVKLNYKTEYLLHECKDYGKLIILLDRSGVEYIPQSYIKDTIIKFNSLNLPVPTTLLEDFNLSGFFGKGLSCLNISNDMFSQYAESIKDCPSNFVIEASKELHYFFSRAFQQNIRDLPYLRGYSTAKNMGMLSADNILNYTKLWNSRISAIKELEQIYIKEGLQVNFIDIYEFIDKMNKPVPEQYKNCLHFLASFLNKDDEILMWRERSEALQLLSTKNISYYKHYISNFEELVETYKQDTYIKAVVAMSKHLVCHVQAYYAKLKNDEERKLAENSIRQSQEDEKRIVNDYLELKITKENMFSIRGGKVAYGVIIEQKLPYERWSQAQWIWIKEAYNALKARENSGVAEKPIAAPNQNNNTQEVNNKYLLEDRPDVAKKVDHILTSQSLYKLPEYLRNIVKTVGNSEKVSDKQIKHVDYAFNLLKNC